MPDPLTYAERNALREAATAKASPSPTGALTPSPAVRATGRGLGDVIEAVMKPIARILQLPCLDAKGRLKPDSGCAKRRDALNEVARLTRD